MKVIKKEDPKHKSTSQLIAKTKPPEHKDKLPTPISDMPLPVPPLNMTSLKAFPKEELQFIENNMTVYKMMSDRKSLRES